jgi:hypothetical protein
MSISEFSRKTASQSKQRRKKLCSWFMQNFLKPDKKGKITAVWTCMELSQSNLFVLSVHDNSKIKFLKNQ